MNKLPVINLKLFVRIFIAFIGFTVIGTLSHELGHYTVARCFGFNASINYMSTNPIGDETIEFLHSTMIRHKAQIIAGQDFPGKEKYDEITARIKDSSSWILFGGPVQTMLTSVIGGLLLIFSYKQYAHREALSPKIWLYVFLALFWLRQSANLFVGIVFWAINDKYGMRGDEARLSVRLGLPAVTLDAVTGLIGLIILAVVVLKVIPRPQQATFFTGGLLRRNFRLCIVATHPWTGPDALIVRG